MSWKYLDEPFDNKELPALIANVNSPQPRGKERIMKKMAMLLSAAFCIMSTVPAFAQMTQSEKDECLLASKNCVDQVDDIYKRMHKLNREIKKGTKVYTPAELRKLKEKLQDTDDMLRRMEESGGS
jgi:hypothetical protein